VLEYAVARAILSVLAVLPRPLAELAARASTRLLDLAIPRLRRTALRNLAMAMPELDEPARRRIARRLPFHRPRVGRVCPVWVPESGR
jgi:lauroyl/myristoyl acyltransferase